MGQWLIALDGEQRWLEVLVRYFPDGDVHATMEGSEAFLLAERFRHETDPAIVQEIAVEVLEEVTAALSIHLGEFPKLNVRTLVHEDDHGRRVEHAYLVSRAFPVQAAWHLSNGRLQSPTLPQQFARLTGAHRHLRWAAIVWAEPVKTWARLYRITEEIESYLGTSPDKRGFCTAAEYRRFTRTANASESAGIDSRHGSYKWAEIADPMKLEDATALVCRLLRRTFEYAAGNQSR